MSKNLDAAPSPNSNNESKTFRYYSQIEAERNREKDDTRLSVRVTKTFFARFKETCALHNVSMASVVKSLVEGWLREHEI